MTKQELEKENEELKVKLENAIGENKRLTDENNALKADVETSEANKLAPKDNKGRLDVLISENIEKIEESPVMNSVMRENLESLCRARNLLGGE